MVTQVSAQQRRTAPRLRSLIAARIAYNNGQSTFDCLIRDLSESGAKLAISALAALPDTFDLIIPRDNRTHRARAMWRRANELGVRFEEHSHECVSPPQSEAALRARVRELEAEVARLQARVAQLTEL